MTVVHFHINVDGPAGTAFSSFPSSILEGGDTGKITLSMIRNRCSISPKLFFTTDGKNSISDSTTLAYYMALTPEGQKILASKSESKPAPTPPSRDSVSKDPSEKLENASPPESGSTVPGLSTLNVKVTDGKVARQLLSLPETNEALNKLLDRISGGGLERGKLPTFTDRELASLSGSYAATQGGYTLQYQEPAELTEDMWDQVLTNTRALHGYNFDPKLNFLVKAPKKAFQLRGAWIPGTPAPSKGKQDVSKRLLPAIPPFYIDDDATVSVTEIKDQFQHTLTKEGFDSKALGISAGGVTGSMLTSISTSIQKERSTVNQGSDQTSVSSIAVTYNFPRVVVELDTDCLELTERCRADAMSVTDSANDKKEFYRKYGAIFVTKFALGGFLHSTRNVSSSEQSRLDQIKNQTRLSAGMSIQTPQFIGGLNMASVSSKAEEDGTASMQQAARLAWNARGGDTLLCSNPPAWASTVKDHRLWRLMKQERLMSLEDLIKDIDPTAFHQLDNPTADAQPVDGNVVTDPAFNESVRVILMKALYQPRNNTYAQKIASFYSEGKMQTAAGIQQYNDFMQVNFPNEPGSRVNPGTLFGGTTIDQRVGLGMFMASKGLLTFW